VAVPHINAGKRTANIKETLAFGACRSGLDAFTVKILISLVTLYYVSGKKATFSNCEALPYFYISFSYFSGGAYSFHPSGNSHQIFFKEEKKKELVSRKCTLILSNCIFLFAFIFSFNSIVAYSFLSLLPRKILCSLII
jgi:hypothetical protein